MGGITSGNGLFSGINTQSLINQLLQIEARPREIIQQRVTELESIQGAFRDLNSRLNSVESTARSFRIDDIFESKRAASSDSNVLSASASNSAQPGTYNFIVDRLVSTQQLLSRGFADRAETGIGAESFTIEPASGRLERDAALAELNGGEGVSRGDIRITQGGNASTIDLSRAVNVSDVIDAINSADDVSVEAAATGEGISITSTAPGGEPFSVSDANGSSTASDLGIAGDSDSGAGDSDTLTGQSVLVLGENTTLNRLNDGNGVFVSDTVGQNRHDFSITVDPDGNEGSGDETEVDVNIGPDYDSDGSQIGPAASTLGDVVGRINTALDDAGASGVSARIQNPDGSGDGARLELVNSDGATIRVAEQDSGTTARDLGLRPDQDLTGSVIEGRRVLADLSGTLARNLNGGDGIGGDGDISVTTRSGDSFTMNLDLDAAETTRQLISRINDNATNNGRVTASLNENGNGIRLTDNTGGTSSNLIVTGQTAESLGIATDGAGVDESTIGGDSLQLAYVARSTRLTELNGGRGVGTGTFRVTDAAGESTTVNIGEDTSNVGQLLEEANSKLENTGVAVRLRVNDNGDGIIAEQAEGAAGAAPIAIEDESGSLARNLRLAGEADDGEDNNFIDGSAEKIVEFDPDDTLQDVADRLNDAGAGISASIINDGNGSAPYRLNLTSDASGSAGRKIIDTGSLDIGLTTLERGRDSRVFFGATDPAEAVLLTSSSNTLDDVIGGVNIDLSSTSDQPVQLTVARDTEAVEAAANEFIEAFNATVERVDFQTRYDQETEESGPLLGDSTALGLRSALFRIAQGEARGLDGPYTRLSQVGITVGSGGKLQLDQDAFRGALQQNPQAVADLFAAREETPEDEIEDDLPPGAEVTGGGNTEQTYSVLGFAGLFEELASDYTDSIDGILTAKRDSLDNQIEVQQGRIESLNQSLQAERERLQSQFLAMERAIGQLQSQQQALSGFNSFF